VGFNVDLGSRSGVDFPGDAKKLHSLGKKYNNKSSKQSADRISIKHSSRAIGEAELEALLSLSTPSGAASPSQSIFDSNTSTCATPADNPWAAKVNAPLFPSTLPDAAEQFNHQNNARNKGKGQSVIPETPLFCAVLTLHLGSAPSHVLSALSGSTSATAVHDTLAIELEVLYMSGVASPSQSILSGSSTSATESTMVDDTFAAGHDMLQFLSTSSSAAGPSHPTFNFTSTSTAEFTMFDDTLVTGYEASQFSSPMLGPSQPIFDLGASTSAAAAELAAELDDKMTAETQSPDISIHSIRWHDPVHKKWLKAKEKDKGIVETNAHKQVVVISIDSKSSQLLCFLLGQIANYRWSPSIPFLPGDRAIDVSDAPAMG